MRAVVYRSYGPPSVLRIEEVPTPEPQNNEIRIRVRAASVTRADCEIRDGNRNNGKVAEALSRVVTGVRGPRRRIPGTDLAGTVDAKGKAVTKFEVGDTVFASIDFGLGGAHAEYVCVREDGRVASVPKNATFEEAAAICDGGLQSLGLLRRSGLAAGQSIVVYGASGAIGSAGVQLAARQFGAMVTAVCGPNTLELMGTLGATTVIDYTAEDFTLRGQRYDVIFDAVGKHSFARSEGSLKPNGKFLATDDFRNLWLGIWTGVRGGKRVLFLPPMATPADVVFLRELVERGIYRPVIDRHYPVEQVVEAARYVETEQKIGNVILTVSD
jgi:NADPH:quinone reductase-like Zn-dependent oxidoreductase